MLSISVIIITKDEAINISSCIKSAKQIANEIIVVDTGSTDETIAFARNENVNVYQIEWNGYGRPQ